MIPADDLRAVELHHEQCPWHSADVQRVRSVCGCPEGWPKTATGGTQAPALTTLSPKKAPMPTRLDLFDVALRGASNALPVLVTMLKTAGLKQGVVVADEIDGNIKCALKVLDELRSA